MAKLLVIMLRQSNVIGWWSVKQKIQKLNISIDKLKADCGSMKEKMHSWNAFFWTTQKLYNISAKIGKLHIVLKNQGCNTPIYWYQEAIKGCTF